jgi:hypothetical protein
MSFAFFNLMPAEPVQIPEPDAWRPHPHARIHRFVNYLPKNSVCVYDPETNVNTINRAVFERLDEISQKRVLRTWRSLEATI